MSTLSDITNGTGFQNGNPPLATDRWTYRGNGGGTGLLLNSGVRVTNPAHFATGVTGNTVRFYFQYTGATVADARSYLINLWDTTSSLETANFGLVSNNAAGDINRIGLTAESVYLASNGVSIRIAPQAANISGNTAYFAIQVFSPTAGVSEAAVRAAWNDFVSSGSPDTSRFEFTDPSGGWTDFNFTLPTSIRSDLFVNGQIPAPADAFIDMDTSSDLNLYKSGLFLRRFATQTADDNNRADDRVLGVNNNGEVVLTDRNASDTTVTVNNSTVTNPNFDDFPNAGNLLGVNWFFNGNDIIAQVDATDIVNANAADDIFIVQTGANDSASGAASRAESTFGTTAGRTNFSYISLDRADLPDTGWTVGQIGYAVSKPIANTEVNLSTAQVVRFEIISTQFELVNGITTEFINIEYQNYVQGSGDFPTTASTTGLVLYPFNPLVQQNLSVIEEGSAAIPNIDQITFDNRHFSVTNNGNGDVEVVLTASAAGGGVAVRNTGNTISTAQADNLIIGSGLNLRVSGTNDADATLTWAGFNVQNRNDDNTSSVGGPITGTTQFNLVGITATAGASGVTTLTATPANTPRIVNTAFDANMGNSFTVRINHNLGNLHPTITVYDSTNEVILPMTIRAFDMNNIDLLFPVAVTGNVAIVG